MNPFDHAIQAEHDGVVRDLRGVMLRHIGILEELQAPKRLVDLAKEALATYTKDHWSCEYCKSLHAPSATRCESCGAPQRLTSRKQEPRVNPLRPAQSVWLLE